MAAGNRNIVKQKNYCEQAHKDTCLQLDFNVQQLFDYLPLASSNNNYISSWTSTYDTQHSYKKSSKSFKGLGNT